MYQSAHAPACPFHDDRHTSKALSFYVKSLSRGNLPLMAAMFAGASNTTKKSSSRASLPRLHFESALARSHCRLVTLVFLSLEHKTWTAKSIITCRCSRTLSLDPYQPGKKGLSTHSHSSLSKLSRAVRVVTFTLPHPNHPFYVIRALEKDADPCDW